jgi:hypothetical protein
MADVQNQYEQLLMEFFPEAVHDLMLRDDDPAWGLINSFDTVTEGGRRSFASSDFPSGFEAKYRIKVQAGGRAAGGSFAGNTLVEMGKGSHLAMGQDASALYLDPFKTPMSSYIPINVILKRVIGQVVANHQQFFADQISTPLEELVGGSIVDATRRVRNLLTNYAYSDGTAQVATVNMAAGVVIPETAGGIEVIFDAADYGRFDTGDLLQFGATLGAGTQIIGSGSLNGFARVVSIDWINRRMKVQSEPGEGDITLADNAIIVLAGTYDFSAGASLATEGFESLLISSGAFPGSTTEKFGSGLLVEDYTALQSNVVTASPQVDPTMSQITKQLDTILDLELDDMATAIIAQRSVWTLWAELERENHALVNAPMGGVFDAAGGVAGPRVQHGPHVFQPFRSKRVRPNSLIGLAPRTWRRFTPMGDRTVNWVTSTGLLAGFPSIFHPVFQGARMSELAAADFNMFFELGCVNPPANFRKIGVNTKENV